MVRGGGHHHHSSSSSSSSSSSFYNDNRNSGFMGSSLSSSSSLYGNRNRGLGGSSYNSYSFYNFYNGGPIWRRSTMIYNNDDSNTHNNNKRKNRCLMIFITIMATVAVVIIISSIKTSSNFSMDEGETRRWIENSYTFNEKLYINDFSQELSIYQLPSKSLPKLMMVPESTIDHNEEVILSAGEYLFFAYHLNKNSKISISFSSLQGISYYLFQGLSNFNGWLDDPDGDSTWKATAYSSNNIKQSTKFIVSEDDTYYLTFDNDNTVSSKFQLQYILDRTQYDFNSYNAICTKQSSCELDLKFNDDRYIYFKAPSVKDTISSIKDLNVTESDINDEVTYQVEVSGEPRMFAIIGLLFCLPVSVFFVLIYGKGCLNKNPDIDNTFRSDNENEGYRSIAMDTIEENENEYEMTNTEAVSTNPIIVIATPMDTAQNDTSPSAPTKELDS